MADTVGQSGVLPSINYLDIEKIKRENSAYNHNIAMTSALTMPAQATLFSPSSIYSGPPPPYSYPSSTSSSVVGGNANGLSSGSGNYTSQAESRRTAGKDREQSSLQRHSLPSITEALTGGDQQQPLSISSLLSSTVTSQPKYSMISKGPTSPVARSYLDAGPKGPPDSFSQHTSSSYRPPPPPSNHSSGPNFSPRTASSRGESGFSAMNGFEPQPQLQPPRTAPSPSHYARPGASPIQHIQPNYPLPSPCQDKNPRPAPSVSNAPFGYNPYQSAPYSYSSSTPSVPSFQTPTLHQHPTWRSTAPEIERVDEIRKAIAAKETSPPRPAYAESVKRHLDIFELETSLNELAEGSGRALEFSRIFGTRAHQTQRSGPLPGSLPSLNECDEMIRLQTKVLDAMSRIRDVICKQQQALVEQRNYDQQNYKPAASEADDEPNTYMDKLEGLGGFAGADAKKRRGRAAPPGRCHSCNRAETPEWRRGPDGARTLCNACGLHYAKLTRKMGPKGSALVGSTNLRPKEPSPNSP